MKNYIYVKDLMLKFTIEDNCVPVPSLLVFKPTNQPIEIRQVSIVPNNAPNYITTINIQIPSSAIYSIITSNNDNPIVFDKNKLYEEFVQNILDTSNWSILIPNELSYDTKYNIIELDENICYIDMLVTEKDNPYLFSMCNISSKINNNISPEELMSNNMSYLYEIKDSIINDSEVTTFINTCVIAEHMHTNNIIIDVKEIINIENKLQPDIELINYLEKYNIVVPTNRLYQSYNKMYTFNIDKFGHHQTSDIAYSDNEYYYDPSDDADNDNEYYYDDDDDDDDNTSDDDFERDNNMSSYL